MTASSVSVCILCHDRPDELVAAVASAREFDEVVVIDMASQPPLEPIGGVAWMRSEVNAGVAAGRNQLAATATGEILVFIDDDATFAHPDAATAIREAFCAPEQPAALAFRIVRPSGETVSSEFPFRGAAREVPRSSCGYFVGCGFAVRRDAYEAAGGFDPRFVYSTEEIDLAFALQNDDRILMYEPSIVVRHAPSTRGRAPTPQIPALRLRNRLLLVRRHLPWPVAVVHAGAWGARTLREAFASRGLREWSGAWREGLSLPVDRRPLRWSQLRAMHARGGRVWW